MLAWKEKRIKRYVQGAQDYIENVFIRPYDGPRFSAADEDDEYDWLEEEETPVVDPESTAKPADDANQQAGESPKPKSEIKYSRRDYGDHLDFPQDDVYGAFRSILRNHPDASLEMLNRYVSPTFVDTLLRYIDQRHLKDSQVYKAAGVDRRLYSKNISDRSYKPARDTCIALCIGLRLNLEDASDLLEKAGYTLSHSNKRDIAIEFFLVEGIYRLQEINEVLDRLGLKILGRE